MVEIATNRVYRENHKDKTEKNNIYSACLVVNHAANGKMYLYDVVNIKKKRVTHSWLLYSQVVQNRFQVDTNISEVLCQHIFCDLEGYSDYG